MKFGCQSTVGKIKSVLLKHPKDAFLSATNTRAQWKDLYYHGCPDYEEAIKEYENFVGLLKEHVPEIFYLPKSEQTGLDSIYVHDPVIITRAGAILCNMGKRQRQDESSAIRDYMLELGIPILGAIVGDGNLEGGDVLWFDERTLAVGRGYRTNDEGIQQLNQLTSSFVDEFLVVPLAHWHGPDEVLHLMSLISLLDRDLAAVYSKLLPIPFREWLLARGIKLLEIPDHEFDTMACNILAVAPRKCVMLSGNPQTKKMLKREGVQVWEYKGDEISLKGAGGPTCLTRPILRE
ncbi:MAG: arginine deiminase family protein [Ignavibacteria bacterium]|nr:arginine deiminase family protein [Ignavibacteria bacterium]